MPEVVQEFAGRIKGEMAKAVVGQEAAIEHLLVALLCRGHVLLEGVPGTAKTLMAKALAAVIGLDFGRVQFTPDLMPADLLGINVFQAGAGTFTFRPGPLFTEILLADEVNRTPPKTQAALLEAMQERQVTLDGQRRPLSPFFTVVATQNPVEYEGTYPLPEAQLDRFTVKVLVDYPSPKEEQQVVVRHHQGFDPHQLETLGLARVAGPEAIRDCRDRVQAVQVAEGMAAYVVEIARRSREMASLTLGASPRASIALLQTSKALAAIRGKAYVTPDEVKGMARPVLRHRIILKPETELEGLTPDRAIEGILAQVPVPR